MSFTRKGWMCTWLRSRIDREQYSKATEMLSALCRVQTKLYLDNQSRLLYSNAVTWNDLPSGLKPEVSCRRSLASMSSNLLTVSGVYNLSPQFSQTPTLTFTNAVLTPPDRTSVTSFSTTSVPHVGHFLTYFVMMFFSFLSNQSTILDRDDIQWLKSIFLFLSHKPKRNGLALRPRIFHKSNSSDTVYR